MKKNVLKFYTSDELFEVLKSLDSDTLVFLHVFPFFDTDIHRFHTYLCEVRNAIALTALLKSSDNLRFTYKIK